MLNTDLTQSRKISAVAAAVPAPVIPSDSIPRDIFARGVAQQGVSMFATPPTLRSNLLFTQYNIEPGAATDQKSSGRCWIFAGLNTMRMAVAGKWGKDFAFSQNYIAYWDKYERAQQYFDYMLEHGNTAVTDAEFSAFRSRFFTQGGEWELFANIVKKYGVVPDYAMPETTHSSSASGHMGVVSSTVHLYGALIHQAMQEGNREFALQLKAEGTQLVEQQLQAYLGKPPSQFNWRVPKSSSGITVPFGNGQAELKGDKAVEPVAMTPLDFLAETGVDFANYVHLVDLAYAPLYTRVVVPEINNTKEGNPLQGLNFGIDAILYSARASIKAGYPVFFGSETESLDCNARLFSLTCNDADKLLGVDKRKLELSKAASLQYNATSIAHAMALVGCDDEVGLTRDATGEFPEINKPMWRIVNSWKDQDTLYATDDWVRRYLYDVVVHKQFLPAEVAQQVDAGVADTILPVSDPFAKI